MLSGIPRRVFESGNLGTGYRDSTRQGVEKLSSLPIVAIDDDGWRGGLDRDGLENIIGNCVADFGWRLVLVDYLGLLATPESDRSDYTTDLLNSTKLKRIAKRFDVALAVIAALRKTSKTTKPEEITLEELSGAGRIAYDAETVCNVWKEYSTPDNGTVHAKILKSRFGPPGDNSTVQLRWVPKTGQILERNHGGHSI
jgi:replicative DNA helicase